MISFRVHEDKENVAPLRNKAKECEDVPQKRHARRRSGEPRKALENVRDDDRISARCPLATGFENEALPAAAKAIGNKKNAIDARLLDRACELIPTDRAISLKTPEDGREKPHDMSIESYSSIKRKRNRAYEERMEKNLYIEPQYRKFIYNYLLEVEHHHRPHPLYMRKQVELNDDMRRILVDWLVSISDEYDLAPVTLHLAVSFVDRFLSKMSVVRTKFQLLGVAAMMIASKYEEIHPPDIYEFSSLTKDTCSTGQILKMEELILRVLSFDLNTPTVQSFIDEYSVQADMSKESTLMAMFISELCLVESVDYISYLPSEVAASSLALSRHTLNEEDMWPKKIEELSNYSLTNLYPLIKMQHQVLEDSPNKALQAVRLKYSRDDFNNVTRHTARRLM